MLLQVRWELAQVGLTSAVNSANRGHIVSGWATKGHSVSLFSDHPASHLVQSIESTVCQPTGAGEESLVLLGNTGRGLPPRFWLLRTLSAHPLLRPAVPTLVATSILRCAVQASIPTCLTRAIQALLRSDLKGC